MLLTPKLFRTDSATNEELNENEFVKVNMFVLVYTTCPLVELNNSGR